MIYTISTLSLFSIFVYAQDAYLAAQKSQATTFVSSDGVEVFTKPVYVSDSELHWLSVDDYSTVWYCTQYGDSEGSMRWYSPTIFMGPTLNDSNPTIAYSSSSIEFGCGVGLPMTDGIFDHIHSEAGECLAVSLYSCAAEDDDDDDDDAPEGCQGHSTQDIGFMPSSSSEAQHFFENQNDCVDRCHPYTRHEGVGCPFCPGPECQRCPGCSSPYDNA
ncbi:hypothetical protein BD324DRAFT_125217 [Kockovaella imperatae]|uniref:Uncharacterized protein n=1 Tax=Kockovaella imperatae TaxID=4999 RepID=A0A1Y1UAW7_9TREE|nr:hypothetical protein BD324DRAFT_125217 [Kockovaella imperatae]ORX34657.1 hypothetical protein BD324DRAFT_125217 [Kockovaella imperatae]